jgi:hypothetical protein
LNAAGRLEHAAAALDLVRTNDSVKAKQLATTLDKTNRERQETEKAIALECVAAVRSWFKPSEHFAIVEGNAVRGEADHGEEYRSCHRANSEDGERSRFRLRRPPRATLSCGVDLIERELQGTVGHHIRALVEPRSRRPNELVVRHASRSRDADVSVRASASRPARSVDVA